jgi:hypothetical protein
LDFQFSWGYLLLGDSRISQGSVAHNRVCYNYLKEKRIYHGWSDCQENRNQGHLHPRAMLPPPDRNLLPPQGAAKPGNHGAGKRRVSQCPLPPTIGALLLHTEYHAWESKLEKPGSHPEHGGKRGSEMSISLYPLNT